ncbi:hypothetical protein SEA_PETTERN_51 [Mycobacterium phage PetterN]|uniref:Uncharacterized protein n=5 Tax=Benedictvirus TaxID=2946819 RepID=A0A482JAI1_9CAUD|nr:hypothetical protein AVT30_gp45 [Mycobacterium phage UnionJack]YP_009207714.1 hypothetical protein AVV06_gp45 [Mycobacterium phage Chadwick]YP_010060762.1 hypothetical protein KIP49_gp41 [Mycobacterium phage Scorpia]AFN37657.1 hypothetical protein ELTIGER69_49 [Mycobacterium phage ElTiger69]AVR76999.1 hypothetical protein SEA_JABIRU_48 [Mycobacterium phage Jabiru]QGJ92221.1 hypothetical protein SEA_MARYSWELL_46 [Mycobacterium phage MarysWell]QGJ97097.1 hypothetical protein SEA_PETTERN_51 [
MDQLYDDADYYDGMDMFEEMAQWGLEGRNDGEL